MPELTRLGVADGPAPAAQKRMFSGAGWRNALYGGIDSANVEQAIAGWDGGGFRARGASYGPLFRAVTLTAQSVAWMIVEGHLRVTDLGGRRVRTQRASRVLDLLAGSLDGMRPSETVWNDAAADYAVFGNGLLAVTGRGRFGVPTQLTLLNASSAFTTEGSARNLMYSAAPAYSYAQSFEHFDSREVVHARWPLLGHGYGSGGNSGSRLGMAESPIGLLDRDIRLGICADMFVMDYFAGGSGGVKSKIAIGMKGALTPAQFETQQQAFEKYKRGSGPLLVGGDPSFTQISESPSDAETDALRKRQAVSTGRIYGIPAPLMSEDGGTSLGSSVDILIRGYWKFGLRYHVAAFLAGARQALLPPGQKFAINEMAANLGDPKYIPGMLNALRGREKMPALASDAELRAYAGLPPEIEGEIARPEPAPAPAPDPPAPSPESG